jgi:hypothetical protein
MWFEPGISWSGGTTGALVVSDGVGEVADGSGLAGGVDGGASVDGPPGETGDVAGGVGERAEAGGDGVSGGTPWSPAGAHAVAARAAAAVTAKAVLRR